jgi:hypothetical protein
VGAPVARAAATSVRFVGQALQGLHEAAEEWGAVRLAPSVHSRFGWLAGRGAPIIADTEAAMIAKARVLAARTSAEADLLDQARINGRKLLWGETVGGGHAPIDDIIRIYRAPKGPWPDLFVVERELFPAAESTAKQFYSSWVPRSASPELFGLFDQIAAGQGTFAAEVAANLGGNRFFMPMISSNLPLHASLAGAALGVAWD